ncbi:MAG: hypothetical protein ACTSRU_03415 [Candidatus Hodarchaeales archaeon]
MKTERSNLQFFRRRVVKWYNNNGRRFSWREKNISCYEHVICEILLRKTHAQTVDRMFLDFIHQYPTWESLVETKRQNLERILWPIGLWKIRAELFKRLAKEMILRNGKFPIDRKSILELPSVGEYVANSVLLFCHDSPQPLIDWNTARVVKRFFEGVNPTELWKDDSLCQRATRIVQSKYARELNWGIIDLGTLICRKRNPKHNECPLFDRCLFVQLET